MDIGSNSVCIKICAYLRTDVKDFHANLNADRAVMAGHWIESGPMPLDHPDSFGVL